MAHILIVDDEAHIRSEWRTRLIQENHTFQEADGIDEAVEAINNSQEQEPFDLILLDHSLGEELGLDLLDEVGKDYLQYRVLVITGHGTTSLAREYASIGAIGHLIKPVSEAQFNTAIASALERRKIQVEEKEDWESAYAVLENLGIFESIEVLKSDSTKAQEQYEILKSTYDQLLDDLKLAGGQEYAIANAYEKATQTLNDSDGSVEGIIPFLTKFKVTKSFWSDVKTIFKKSRLYFFVLQSYLLRIAENPLAYRIKHLAGGADGHYEYRIGSEFRLYFRKEADDIILERFANKNIQPEIIKFLNNTHETAFNSEQLIN
ncbi:response regulator [Geminocystis sp. NIES-3709]|uniref:response regulator n=1 Tax=Geminocystis sp. NIES-3709 TaxID=1617448 RepID=UPI0005FCC898|nr:response regulator [Geminocystis sp. NIES-3709]BAQ63922.1 transcriptional regulator [Geminocystis sp. NIES-3709]